MVTILQPIRDNLTINAWTVLKYKALKIITARNETNGNRRHLRHFMHQFRVVSLLVFFETSKILLFLARKDKAVC